MKFTQATQHNYPAWKVKYTDLQALGATASREFIDRIEISAIDKDNKERKIHIVYNFIGTFDFESAIKQAQTKQEQQKTA